MKNELEFDGKLTECSIVYEYMRNYFYDNEQDCLNKYLNGLDFSKEEIEDLKNDFTFDYFIEDDYFCEYLRDKAYDLMQNEYNIKKNSIIKDIEKLALKYEIMEIETNFYTPFQPILIEIYDDAYITFSLALFAGSIEEKYNYHEDYRIDLLDFDNSYYQEILKIIDYKKEN